MLWDVNNTNGKINKICTLWDLKAAREWTISVVIFNEFQGAEHVHGKMLAQVGD